MSSTGYKGKPYEKHTFLCKWSVSGKQYSYKYVYSGNVIDGIIACYESVLWSSAPDFTIELKETTVV